MSDTPTPEQTLRAKIIGAQLQDARLAAKKSIEECAQALSLEADAYVLVETGERPISLPELETLAFLLDVPLEHFWERQPLPPPEDEHAITDMQSLMALRHRMIGALMRQARLEAGYSLESLAERSGVDAASLEAYEFGRQPVPLPLLESLSGLLHRSIREFQDQHGPIGEWNARRKAVKEFLALPLELQVFISKPINRPFIELAQRLNDMSVDKLRAVAEGLLEITY
jgi:transcriptional regulator with XRE-family HTH domain